MTIESEAFGALLRRHRGVAGLTQEELAERAGLSVRGISDLERGANRAPYLATVARLTEALGLSEEDSAALEAATSRRRGPGAARVDHDPVALPTQPTSLIGRERDEAAVVHLLRWEGRRLVTLTGPGGVGKTRLALQAASTMAGDFADGAVFVPLASLRDPSLVLPAIAGTLGAREQDGQLLQESLAAYLEEREVLLVLDNVEQVAEAAPSLAALLAACPKVKALVTSRVSLHLRGEQCVDVVPLSVPPSGHAGPVDGLSRYPSVVLFVERARSVNPNFVITSENGSTVARICRRLDGLPLAIELAAARLKILSPQALLTRLERRLQVLTGGTCEVAPRQQTMRNTIAWSHDLLEDHEQIIFRRLSVFAGGWSLEAAEAVCTSGHGCKFDVFEALASLADKSLLLVEEQQADNRRLHMLDTTREFARERLEACGEAESMLCQHARYYLTVVEKAEPELRGREQGAWLARLDRERDNVRAALQWALESGEIETGLRIAGALWWFWYARGYLSEGGRWLELLLSGDQQDRPVTPAVRAKALRAGSALAAEQGDYTRAVALAEESLDLFQELGDMRSLGTVLTVLGNIAKYQVDYARAASLYADALALFRELGERQSIAVSLNNLGNLAKEQTDHRRALALYEESLAMKRELGDRRGIAIALSNIGTMAHAQGDDKRAAEAGEESVALLRELGDKDLASALDTLARAVLAQGDDQRAMELYREALMVSRAAGEKQLMALCLEGMGRVAAAQGNAERAAQLYGAGVSLHETIGAPLSPAEQVQAASYLDAAREELGTARFTAAWERGQAMALDQAVACALDDGRHSSR